VEENNKPDPFADIAASGAQAPQGDTKPDPFANIAPSAPQSSSAQSANAGSSDSGAFMAGVESMNRQFGRIAEGIMQKTVGALVPSIGAKIDAVHNNLEASNAKASEQHPLASTVGSVLGGIGSYVAYSPMMGGPGGSGSIAANALSNFGQGALLGGASYTEKGQSGLDTALKSGAYGAAFGVGAQALGGLLKGAGHLLLPEKGFLGRMINPKGAVADDLAQIVNSEGGLDNMVARGQAAERIGVPLSPGQQLGGSMAAKEGSVLANDAAKAKVVDYVNKQEALLRPKAENLINQLVPEGVENAKALKNQLYENLGKTQVPDELLGQLKANPYINDTLNEINNSKFSVAKDLPDNNLLKLDAVKQQIDDDLWNSAIALKDSPKNLSTDTRNYLLKTRAELVNTLDNFAPDPNTGYAATRKVAERLINQNKFITQLGKINDSGQSKGEVSLDQMYSRLWGNKEKKDFFLNAVQNAGADVQTSKDVLEVLNDTFKSPMKEIIGRTPAKFTLSNLSHNKGSLIERGIEHFTKGTYNHDLIAMMLNPSWQTDIQHAIISGNNKKSFFNLGNLVKQFKQSNIGQAAIPAVKAGIPIALGNMQAQGKPVAQTAGVLGVTAGHGLLHHLNPFH
jgi:hypothetical protein